ncbi:MAG: hypothetical protein IJ856_07080 [Candidatus Methanomethylophilaceae archaeon]|nr:hypothetical protein [Candidatus Methanomethylophilaceae archaeon]
MQETEKGNALNCQVTMMNDDGFKITLRVSQEEIEAIDDFMRAKGVSNRSLFIREVVSRYISESEGSEEDSQSNGIFVHLNDVHLQALQYLVDQGVCLNPEEYVRRCVTDKLLTKEAEEKAINNAFEMALTQQRMR